MAAAGFADAGAGAGAAAAAAALLAAAAGLGGAGAHQGNGTVECVDPLSSAGLSRAVDAALMELQGRKGWFHGLRASSGYANAQSVFSCTPDADKWAWPKAEEVGGLLQRVLERGELVVAGVQWSSGAAANYKDDPENPTGFWPEYLDAVVGEIGQYYGTDIKVRRRYYADSALVVDAVTAAEDVDMSEPYYYLSGFNGNEPRIESMGFSCITAGLASNFYTAAGSGVTDLDALFDAIEAGPNRAVGFVGKGNYDAVSSMLPDSVTPTYITNSTELAQNVASGVLVAGYVSEGAPPGAPAGADPFNSFPTGITSPRAVLFRKDRPVCSEVEPEKKGMSGHGAAGIASLVILSLVMLILAGTLAFTIYRERQGSPLFMPLLGRDDSGAQMGRVASRA